MKLMDIISARQALSGLTQEELDPTLAYRLTKFIIKTQDDYDFYAQRYQDLITQHNGVISDKGIEFSKEDMDKFNKDNQKLLETEVEDPGIRFKLKDLSSQLKMSMTQMFSLMSFIDDETDGN